MIPIRDTIKSDSYPFITTIIVIANILVFIKEMILGPALEEFVNIYGVVPIKFFSSTYIHHTSFLELITPLFTSMFIHGDILHILGNLWFLWIFGDNVEDKMGHFKYLLFYLTSGIVAMVFHIVTNSMSQVPAVGASGAIAGVMGAYMILFPMSRILTLVPIIIFFSFIELPAFFFLGLWFVYQFLLGTLTLGMQGVGGIAFWAHIGGFIWGFFIAILFKTTIRTRKKISFRKHKVDWDKIFSEDDER